MIKTRFWLEIGCGQKWTMMHKIIDMPYRVKKNDTILIRTIDGDGEYETQCAAQYFDTTEMQLVVALIAVIIENKDGGPEAIADFEAVGWIKG